jgi:hypothetical protein
LLVHEPGRMGLLGLCVDAEQSLTCFKPAWFWPSKKIFSGAWTWLLNWDPTLNPSPVCSEANVPVIRATAAVALKIPRIKVDFIIIIRKDVYFYL